MNLSLGLCLLGMLLLPGAASAYPVLDITSNTFPATAAGDTTAAVRVTVTSHDDEYMTIQSVQSLSPHFPVVGASCFPGLELGTGFAASCYFDVEFHPTSAFQYTNYPVTVTAGDATEAFIEMSGLGIAPLTPAVASYDFGTTESTDHIFTFTNNRSVPLTVSGTSITGVDSGDFLITSDQSCTENPIPAAGTCTVAAIFEPDSSGAKSASLHLTHDGAGGAADVPLTGTGIPGNLVADEASVEFTDTDITADTVDGNGVAYSNTGDDPVTIGQATITGADAGEFDIWTDGDSCSNAVVQPNDSCIVPFMFNPSSLGAKTATANLPNDGTSGAVSLVMNGIGIDGVGTADPTTLPFFAKFTDEGATAIKIVTLHNTGNAQLNLSPATITGPNASDFAIVTNECAIGSLIINDDCIVTIAFDPSAGGDRTATLHLKHDGSDGETLVALTGLGVTPSVTPAPVPFPSLDLIKPSKLSRLSALRFTGSCGVPGCPLVTNLSLSVPRKGKKPVKVALPSTTTSIAPSTNAPITYTLSKSIRKKLVAAAKMRKSVKATMTFTTAGADSRVFTFSLK